MADRPRPLPKKRTAKAAGEIEIAPMATQRKADVPAPASNPPAPASNLTARISHIEAERDRLKAELAAAKAQIATLETARDQVLNRIDWVIDSLHTLSRDSGDSGC